MLNGENIMGSIYNALIEIVGEDYASNRQEELFTYSKDLGTSEPQWPEYVVAPKTTEAVQKIVRLANKEKIAIVPLGGGMTLAGLALPLKGGITIDMKRMEKIIEVNESGRYMVVEAGVSQGKITSYLHKHHPHLMHSEPGAPPAATVGGNLAIHGQGIWPILTGLIPTWSTAWKLSYPPEKSHALGPVRSIPAGTPCIRCRIWACSWDGTVPQVLSPRSRCDCFPIKKSGRWICLRLKMRRLFLKFCMS